MNAVHALGPNHWAACGDRRFAPDNMVRTGSRKGCPAPATCWCSTTGERPATSRADLPVVCGACVLEINAVTRAVVWQYPGPKRTFFSPRPGSAQRLPTGNTLIDEGIRGRFFQVAPAGKIVWEYLSPFVGKGPRGLQAIPWVYRMQAVPYGWVP